MSIYSFGLEKGADVNATDNDGRTALSIAYEIKDSVDEKMEKIIKLFINKGAYQ